MSYCVHCGVELGAAARDLYVLAASAREERRGGSDWRTGPAVI